MTEIDWYAPIQWDDGTPIDSIEVLRSIGAKARIYGPNPRDWPAGCTSASLGVYVDADGRIGGHRGHPRHVINAPVAKDPPPPSIDASSMETSPLWGAF